VLNEISQTQKDKYHVISFHLYEILTTQSDSRKPRMYA
jgi:hypothetical protein